MEIIPEEWALSKPDEIRKRSLPGQVESGLGIGDNVLILGFLEEIWQSLGHRTTDVKSERC